MNIDGSLQAGNILSINMLGNSLNMEEYFDEFFSLSDEHKFFVHIEGDRIPNVMDNFPFRWSFLKVGRFVDYQQLVGE